MIGGHTEISYGLDRPIVIGSMLGEVEKEKLVTTSGAEAGDYILLTKGIVIEGTAIIAREKQAELLKRGYTQEFIQGAINFLHNPGISVVKDALLANQYEVHSMHDPTEGGLAAGIYEMAKASGKGVLIYGDKISVFPESQRLCDEFGLNVLGTIASGALLLAASPENAESILKVYEENGIHAAIIGEIREEEHGFRLMEEDRISDLEFSEKDEITKLFE